MQYKNFSLRIESKLSDGYPVAVETEGMGETFGTFTLSADCLKIVEDLKDVENLQAGSALPRDLGSSLYQCLFQNKVGILLYKCLGSVKDEEQGLRIQLRLSPAEIAALPWEVLYDQDTKCFLATSSKTPLTRYIELSEPIKALKIEPPVKILTLIPGGSGLEVDKEEQIIEEALGNLAAVEMRVIKDKVTRSEISRALVEDKYHILHFIGHGTFENDEGSLLINSENGESDVISATTFADFFRGYPSLKLVVLNACQGAEVSATRQLAGLAPQLVARGIPAVVAMQYPISDTAALTFAREFYLKLCTGWSRGQVDSAISHARNRINMDVPEPLAFATPVLFLRSPTGVIFDLENEKPQGIFSRIARLISGSPVKQVNRLKEVKKTYEKNIEVWQDKAKDADPETRAEAAAAIAQEQEEMNAVDQRIVQWNKAFFVSLSVTLVVFILGYAGLFNIFHADDWLESRFIPYMDDYIVKKFNPGVRLIMSDEGDNGNWGKPGPSWRPYHAALIDALAGKAKVIVFDLNITDSSPADKQLAAAIKRAEEKNSHIIVGKRVRDDGAVLADIAADLRTVINDHWGNIDVVGQHWGFVRVYQLAQSAREAQPKISVPSLALQAVTQFLAPDQNGSLSIDARNEHVQLNHEGAVKSIPVYQTAENIYDLPYGMIDYSQIKDATRSYRDVYAHLNDPNYFEQFRDTIVIIGYKTPEELFSVARAQRRYGAEIHANVISDILENIYVRWLPTTYDLLIVAIMAAIGALVQARFPNVFTTRIAVPFTQPKKKFAIPGLLILLDVIYLMVAFLLYRFGMIYILKTHHLFTPFIAYWLTGKMRRRAALKPTAGVTP
jgi:CHASE2 domain-containing sensor protein